MAPVRPIHVWFEDGVEGGAQFRRLIFEGVEDPRTGLRAESWWRIPDVTDLPAPPALDSLVCGHLLWAAMFGQDVVVHGPMTRGGLYNMGQLIEIRHALSPGVYPRPISIMPDQVVTLPRPADDRDLAMVAVSGGLDSTFTAVRHVRRLVGDAAFPVAGFVLIHGYDVPLVRSEEFVELRRRVGRVTRWLDRPLYTVVTNSMATGGRAWPQSALPLVAASLAHFSDRCPVGLVSTAAPHGTPRFGITHPAALDALASNDFFRVVSDGGGFGRADKVEALLPFPEAIASIKVCWRGADPARNCGSCEKCVMTRLNFLAAGLPDPPCFDTPLTLAHVAGLDLPSVHAARDLFRLCWNELERRGRTGPVVDLLRRRLARVPPDDRLRTWFARVEPRVTDRVRRMGRRVSPFVPARIRREIRRRLPPSLRP